MCGISGILSLNTSNGELVKSLPNLLDAIKHRGPDDEGAVFFSPQQTLTTFGNDTPDFVKKSNLLYSPTNSIKEIDGSYYLGLGHRRLSILDLSEYGHQPMCDDTKNYWIVFNGEIYNYKKLKLKLEKLGHQFYTQTDTEVIIIAYKEWKEKCVDKLDGMWSFVIYDLKNKEIFGARDRFGVKPFYYINNENYFAFSSEIKSLIHIPGFKKKINPNAVYDYLISGKLEIDNESFFKNIYELKPAHYFKYNINEKAFKLNKYYQLNTNNKWESFNKNKANEHSKNVYNKVYQAIKDRLNADVKVGTCLSGGIDSSITTCVINDILKTNNNVTQQEVYTAAYPKSIIDEENWASIVVNSTNSSWNKTYPTAQDLKLQLEDLVYYQDIPFTSSSSFSQYKVMELVSNTDVKVTIDGQGADELFAGYSPHYVSIILNSFKNLDLSSFFSNFYSKSSNFSNKSLILKLLIKNSFARLFPKSYAKKLFSNQPELSFINNSFLTTYQNRITLKNNEYSSNLNNLLANEFTENKLKHLLRLADRNSMRFSIESRTPFVDDKELVEYAFNVPAVYKIRNGTSKYLLREAFKNLIPKEIHQRKDKIGFATPENEWLVELKPTIKELFVTLKNDEFVNWEEFYSNFDAVYDNAINTNTQRLWRLINFAVWRKIYNV